MKKTIGFSVMVAALTLSMGTLAGANTIYDSIPSPAPYNLPSLGYQATSTAEFGDYIGFSDLSKALTTVDVAMSTWALKSSYQDTATGTWKPGFEHVVMNDTGYQHPLTLNIYAVDTSGSTPVAGSLIASKTVTAMIPWRPENNVGPDGKTYGGMLFNVAFDFSDMNLVLPEQIVYGLAFNTYTGRANPIGKHGPYESLNFGCSSAATTGTDFDPSSAFWNTTNSSFYTDKGEAGVGTFRQDTGGWAGCVPAVRFSVVPEPATIGFLVLGGLSFLRRRK